MQHRATHRLVGKWGVLFACVCWVASVLPAAAQIPSVLTDKLFRGAGEINLLQDVSGADLTAYLNGNGGLLLGVDVNENASGPESSS